MRYDEYLATKEEILMSLLKGQSRMEKDKTIGEYENGEL